jgi:hypothetical protein
MRYIIETNAMKNQQLTQVQMMLFKAYTLAIQILIIIYRQ